jgi:hypothetical protein
MKGLQVAIQKQYRSLTNNDGDIKPIRLFFFFRIDIFSLQITKFINVINLNVKTF